MGPIMLRISTILLVMFLVANFDMKNGGVIVKVEANLCEGRSHTFRGVCLSDTNCARNCQTEGFHDGHCEGFRRRCFCRKIC